MVPEGGYFFSGRDLARLFAAFNAALAKVREEVKKCHRKCKIKTAEVKEVCAADRERAHAELELQRDVCREVGNLHKRELAKKKAGSWYQKPWFNLTVGAVTGGVFAAAICGGTR